MQRPRPGAADPGPGIPITGKTPDELTVAIRADWARRSAR